MRAPSAIPAARPWEKQINAALAAFAQMRYFEALDHFQGAYAEAEKAGASPELRGRILRGMGACWLGLSDYNKALAHFQAARPYTILGGDREGLAALDANIASTYVYQGDLKTGEEVYRRALSWLAEIPDSPHRAAILANLALANLMGRQYRSALRLLPPALKAAQQSADRTTEANIHDFFGFAYLGLGDYPRARAAFEHSVGARESMGPGADLTRPLLLLGRTELEAGNPGAALDQLDRCVASAEQRDSRFDLWQALYFRARAQLALGKSEIAITDLKQSVSVLESIRSGLLANDTIRLLYEVNHHEVYGVLADLLCGMGRPAEAFQAVELGRAQSLRALLEERPSPAAKRAQNARPAIVGNADDTAIGTPAPETAGLIECQRKILNPESLLLNYYVGSKGAYLWAVTDSETRFYRLPPPAQWSGGVPQFVEAIQAPGADARLIGERLYQALLGPVEKSMLEKRHWIIAADGDLVVLPFCALPLPPFGNRAMSSGAQAEPSYVIEKHSVSYVPSVSVLAALGRQTPAEYEYDFLGMADPVVNRADSRWHGSPPLAMPGSKALPRLVASEAEIRACGRAFSPERLRLMTGFQLSMSGIDAARQHSYRYWHLASHVVADTEHPDSSFVALSISRATSQTGGRLEKLTASDIVGLKINTEMVLVNGCDSGSGKNLPGAGVVGLARAFLAAGARSVCATRWRMPDEGGDLAAGLYRRLAPSGGQRAPDRAEALRQAQLDMIRSADWRAQPRYWAAYFLMGAGS